QGVLDAQRVRAGGTAGGAVHVPPAEVVRAVLVLAPEDVGLAVAIDVAGADHAPAGAVGRDRMAGEAVGRSEPDDDARLTLLPPHQVGETVAIDVAGGTQDIGHAQGIGTGAATDGAIHRPPADVVLAGDVLAP